MIDYVTPAPPRHFASSTCVNDCVDLSPAVSFDPHAMRTAEFVNGRVVRVANVATQTVDVFPAATHAVTASFLVIEPGAPVIDYVSRAPAAIFAAPSPATEYVVPVPGVTDTAPSPMIDHVESALGFTYTVPFPVTKYVAPAPGVTYDGPSPLIDHVAAPLQDVAPALGITSTAPSPAIEYTCVADEIDDITRCLNDRETGHLSTTASRP